MVSQAERRRQPQVGVDYFKKCAGLPIQIVGIVSMNIRMRQRSTLLVGGRSSASFHWFTGAHCLTR